MDYLEKIMLDAGKIIRAGEGAANITVKGIADYVTRIDVDVQKYIQNALYEKYPDIQFMGEEKDNNDIDYSSRVWILDPVDGTTNLIHDYRHSAISLALMDNGEIVLGIIYNPYTNEMFTAKKGMGAYLNNTPIHVSTSSCMADSLIAIGTSPYYKDMADKNFDIFKRVFTDCQDIRRSGSAAIDLASVACGRIDAYFERHLKLWDYAAGLLLVREAGGCILGYDGDDIKCTLSADIIAGNNTISRLLLDKYL